ncbi:MAG: hypothetical protein AB1782_20945 [Cyanobacteriota bacterium]
MLPLALYAQVDTVRPDEKPSEPTKKSELSLDLHIRDGICRNTSPVMIDLIFKNSSIQPQKLCIYNFYESLIKLDIRSSSGKKLEFNPKLVKADKITEDDWVIIPPGRAYKRTFSLTRRVIDATGYRIAPDNYSVKAFYEGCAKFDPAIPDQKIESNWLYLLITD